MLGATGGGRCVRQNSLSFLKKALILFRFIASHGMVTFGAFRCFDLGERMEIFYLHGAAE